MRPDKREKIDTLLLKQLSGSLSSAETATLQQLREENTEVKALWTALEARMATPDAQLFKQNLDAGQDWPVLLSRIHENKRAVYGRKFKFGLLITTMAAVIVYSSTLFIKRMATNGISSKQTAAPASIKPAGFHYSNTAK